jgi:hypothetical protein
MNNTDDSVSDFKKKNRHFQVWIPSKLMAQLEAELKTLEEEIKKSSSSPSGIGISTQKMKTNFLNWRTKRNFRRIQIPQNAFIILFLTCNGIATERKFQKKSVFRPIASNAKNAFQGALWRNV